MPTRTSFLSFWATATSASSSAGDSMLRKPTPARIASWSSGAVLPTPENTDRKSTRLNSSHSSISYAVFCLKKKKKKKQKKEEQQRRQSKETQYENEYRIRRY